MARPFKNPEDQAESLRERYPWATFHAGHWTKEQPKRAGTYYVATREGAHKGFRVYVEYQGRVIPAFDSYNYHKGWDAWFWSEPVPLPAKPLPLWDDPLPDPPKE